MTRAALLIVGSEMLDPRRADANGPLARERLAELGIPLASIARVEDSEQAIAAALGAALATADVVLLSGGLGPTGDDLTREGVARALGRGVRLDADWLAELERRLVARGRAMSDHSRRQAHVVEGGEVIANGRGLACGTLLEADGKMIALLPGVPPEFAQMLEEGVLPRVAERFPHRPATRLVRAVAAGLPEAAAEPVLAPWYRRPGVAVSILPSLGVLNITFTLTAAAPHELDALEKEVRSHLAHGLGEHLVSLEGTGLPEAVGGRLLARGLSLAVAESCSGGRLAHRIVSVPGASRYFRGGIVAYANDAKVRLLGVAPELIERYGAVSEPVALAMMRGARARFEAGCALSITGIAGPGGATPAKPVGLVFLAAGTPGHEEVRSFHYPLDRESITALASHAALYMLWQALGPARRGTPRREG
jgi:nicotinamide-nucleotide amidase